MPSLLWTVQPLLCSNGLVISAMIICSGKSLAPTVREGAGSAHAAAPGSRHKAVAMRAERRRCDSRVMGFILHSVWVQGIDAARDEVVLGLADQEIEQHRDERGGNGA